jgi:hypothetical protein
MSRASEAEYLARLQRLEFPEGELERAIDAYRRLLDNLGPLRDIVFPYLGTPVEPASAVAWLNRRIRHG